MRLFIMSALKKSINYGGLEEELQEALRADTMYQLRNDAKLRALEQNVPTYEHFRQMVNGAHLKPLEAKDTAEKTQIQWNSFTSDKNNPKLGDESSGKSEYREALSKTAQEFYQSWKDTSNVDHKIEFLSKQRIYLPEIFRVEIPIAILKEFLNTCLISLSTTTVGNYNSVLDILNSLADCNRFQLAVTFMTHQDKDVCRQLFDKLASISQVNSMESTSEIIQLAKKYCVFMDA